jgi:hypothetical protein
MVGESTHGWNEGRFWRDHGLLTMTDQLQSRVDRDWMADGKSAW